MIEYGVVLELVPPSGKNPKPRPSNEIPFRKFFDNLRGAHPSFL